MVIDPDLTDWPYYSNVRRFRRILDSKETIYNLVDAKECLTEGIPEKNALRTTVESSQRTTTDIFSNDPHQEQSVSNRSFSMAEHSKYQQKIIRNYYENRENIALQRAQEIVTELYLSEGKKRQKYWKNLETHLLKLGTQTRSD